MDTFVRDSFREFKGQTNFKKAFVQHTEQIYEVFRDSLAVKTFITTEKRDEDFFLCLIEPVVEIAWADGRVTTREMDALIQIADSYALVDCEETYCRLMSSLISRPSPKESARARNRFNKLLDILSAEELKILSEAILIQAQFVAERSSNNLIDFLRGNTICTDEISVLEKIKGALEKAEMDKREGAQTTSDFAKDNGYDNQLNQNDLNKLLPLVPLVKVAWAEGRITNREKQIIFDAAHRLGITAESAYYQRLCEWLQLHPTDDFYNESLHSLRSDWEKLDSEGRRLRQLDILSDCTLIAEASGGNSEFAAGGPRVCDEEIFAVKQIARKLKFNQSIALS